MTDDLTPPIEQSDIDEFNLNEAPRWPKVVGIISIVWGAVGLTCAGCGLGSSAFMGSMVGSQLNGAPLPPAWQFGTVDYVIAGLGLLLSIVIIVAGIQTILRKRMGWALHLVYGLCAIPLNIASALNGFAKQSAMPQWAEDYPDNPIAEGINRGGADQTVGMIVGVLMILFFMLYPLFIVIWFGLIKNKHEQMTGGVEEMY